MTALFLLIWLHFLGDFILQTDKMALNKSKSFKWLGAHALTYGLPLLVFGWKFAIVNAVLHGLVDAVTSRLTSYLWQKNERHWFFVVIGTDQAIHMCCLLATFFFL